MKKIIALIFIILSCFSGWSQETYFVKEGPIVSNVIGWGYDEINEVWLRCENHIENNRLLYSFNKSDEWISHDFNNIISLQCKSLKYDNEMYYVIVWEKFDGKYKYPETFEDWEYWKTKMFMLFSEDDFKSITNLTYSYKVFHTHTFVKGKYENSLSDIEAIFKGMNYQDVVFVIKETPDGRVRFNIKKRTPPVSENEFFEMDVNNFLKFINIF